jgi:hypothetical protein
MTYLVELTNEHALGVLKSLEKAGVLTVQEDRSKAKKPAITRQQQTNRILNSVREGLEQVNPPLAPPFTKVSGNE